MTVNPSLAKREELDIQACYRMIESLQERESRYRRLLEISIDGFWERDFASGSSYLSPRWKWLAGYGDTELPNTFEAFVSLIDDEDRERVLTAIDTPQTDTDPYVIEFRMRHRDQRCVWVKMRGKTIFGADGTPQLAYGSAVDISRETQMESALTESECRLKLALEGSSQGVWDWNLQTGEIYFSPEWKALLGYRQDEIEDSAAAWDQLIHPEDRPRAQARLDDYLRREAESYAADFRVRCRDGRYRWVHARGTIVQYDATNAPLRMIGTHADVHERKQVEERLRLSAAVLEHAKEAIVTTDSENRIIAVNPAFTGITGYSAEEVIGRDPSCLSSGRHSRSFYRKMWHSLQRIGAWEGEMWNRRKNGDVYPQWLSISLIRDDDGNITHHIGVASDNTERKAVQERLEHLAHFDTLTQLPNRLLVRDRLQQALRAARRQNTTLALLFVDLDRFKIINDSLGHHVGDTLLQSVAERILTCVRDMDTVGRHGGDEFTVVLPEVDRAAAALIAQRIVESVSTPYFLCNHELAISSSIGVAAYPADGEDVDTLLQNADTAMYHAKQAGRANVRFFEGEMNASANRQLEMAAGLRKALQANHFELHYQPQVELATGRVVAVEALIRWRTPQGLIKPASFLPVAAQNGLLPAIDDWVLRTACVQMKAWQTDGALRAKVAVNVSASRLSDKGFVRRVAEILETTGLEPGWLELEITERTTVESAEAAAGAIVVLRDMGVSVSIDDFGTGYSWMSYLKSFRVDKLKIDPSFVAGLPDDADSAAIAEAIINLGGNMGHVVIAKGVETLSQLEYLSNRGLKVAQGHLFAAPAPADLCLLKWEPGCTETWRPTERRGNDSLPPPEHPLS